MLAFKVEIDGVHVATAGVDDWSILTLHVDACRGDPDAAFDHARSDRPRFSVGGLSEPDPAGVSYHFRWPALDLQVGSRVLVTVVETDEPTPPVKRYRSDAVVQ